MTANGPIGASGADAAVNNSTVTTTCNPETNAAISVSADEDVGTAVASGDVAHGGCYGIVVDAADDVVTDNEVHDATHEAAHITGQFSIGTTVSGNTGTGNHPNAALLSGEELGGFAWVPPSDTGSLTPWGYVSDTLLVRGPGTVSFSHGQDAQVGHLGVHDATLDATAGAVTLDGYDGGDAIVGANLTTNAKPSAHGVELAHATVVGDVSVASVASVTTPPLVADQATIRGDVRGTSAAATVTNTTVDGKIRLDADGTQDLKVSNNQTESIDLWNKGPGGLVADKNTVTVHADAPQNPTEVDLGINAAGTGGGPVKLIDNEVIGPAKPFGPTGDAAAMSVTSSALRLGPTGNVTGNTVAGNGGDFLVLEGTLGTDATWKSPQQTQDQHDVGYAVGRSLTIPSAATLTIPADARVYGPGTFPVDIPTNYEPEGLEVVGGDLTVAPGTTISDLDIGF
ncbi:MAG: hypothetical protein JO246_02925, partial [Frankiaceae bacterium]|nr:hypothetical protein [Frankiaceae bacterium]